MKRIILLLYIFNTVLGVKSFLHFNLTTRYPAFDDNFYENLLDPNLCQEQLAYIKNDTELALSFIESGLRFPRGIAEGNLQDFGNYFQCININKNYGASNIEGKFCIIYVPLNQDFQLSDSDRSSNISDWIDFDPTNLKGKLKSLRDLKRYRKNSAAIVDAADSRPWLKTEISEESLKFTLAVCVPKVCTTEDWIDGILYNLTENATGIDYAVNFCRTNGDKLWVTADYVALIIFSALGFLTLISTIYDLWHVFILKTNSQLIPPLPRNFSLYTNACLLTTFTEKPGTLECLDGIRAITLIWIIFGHMFSNFPPESNVSESNVWTYSIASIYVTAAPVCVETFFMLSGMLLVYTGATKFTGMKLLKNLHLFYLNRLLRMFPLLAAAVLIQASFFYHLADGPWFVDVAVETDKCRIYWWSTLLYIQNYVNSVEMCLTHSWYLAIDTQCYILSPIILFWVVGDKKKSTAWIALTTGFLCVVVSATIYIFINNFPGSHVTYNRNDELEFFIVHYYHNTLTRASTFILGMIFGYLLHISRKDKIIFSKFTVLLLWICVLVFLCIGLFSTEPMKDKYWHNQTVDNLTNSFVKIIWTTGVGLTVIACVHGYGGPINWFLSHKFWKLPSRLSYAMYITHYPILVLSAGTQIPPVYFTPLRTLHRFFSDLAITFIVSFIMSVFIDSPFSTLSKMYIGRGLLHPESDIKS